jgi:transcriptional regulator with XRE-family HTH domain
MDDIRVGLVIRAIRIRRGLRQADLAELAGISAALVSLVERGKLEDSSVKAVRRIASALGIRLPFEPRWRGAELATLLDERHAEIVRSVVARLIHAGWTASAEVTFAIGRESGSIDILAWLEARRALLLVEVKSELADLQDLLAAFDRKRRLAPAIVRDLGLRPLLIGTIIVFPDETRARRAVERNAVVLDRRYPARALEIRRWLARPERDLGGIWFLPISTGGSAGRKRVRRKPPPGHGPHRSEHVRAWTRPGGDRAMARGTGSAPYRDRG